MSLVAAQDALVTAVRAAVPDAVRSVEAGPGAWDKAYFERVVAEAPAVRVAFVQGAPRSVEELQLVLDTQWTVIAITPWSGRSRQGAAPALGADGSLSLAAAIAGTLQGCKPDDEALGQIWTLGVERIWTGEIDRKGRSICAVVAGMQVAVDPAAAGDELADLAGFDVDWALAPRAGAGAEQTINLEES